MSWTPLKTTYTDASWVGDKEYQLTQNPNGTTKIKDVTVYTNKEDSFFGANDANAMNGAINSIMDGSAEITSGKYVVLDYTIPSYTEYTPQGTEETDIKFYADVTALGVTTSMVAQPIPDVFKMKSSDMGKWIATDTMNGSVRMYFTAKPTTYVLRAFLLTIAKEEE